MMGLTWNLMLQAAVVATGANTYQEAYQQATGTGRPLLVLVGAQWCPACRVMKDSTLPQLNRAGGLRDVAFCTVDADRQPDLADRLMQGSLLPQLVVYSRAPQGWRRGRIVGGADRARVEALIRQAVQWQKPAPRVARRAAGPG